MSLNTKFSDILSRLSDVMSRTGETMKARAYKNAEENILGMTSEIHSVDDLKGKPGFGPAILSKLQEYVDTGKIALLEREENRPELVFTNIYGIGPKKAAELVTKGFTTIDSLRKQPEVLNDVQRIGLKHYEDILKRIPRDEIVLYDKEFKRAFKSTKDAAGRYEIVGSYRRGLASSGDIDVIVGSPTPATFDIFLDALISRGIIREVLSRGKNKCLVVAKIPDSETFRRVDFLYATLEEYPFSVLYFTGSKGFNAVMRGHALTLGYTLNEHGLSIMKDKQKGALVDKFFPDEVSIFDFLGLKYKQPAERVDGRAVITKEILHEEVLEKEVSENISEKKVPEKKVSKKVTEKKVTEKKSPEKKVTEKKSPEKKVPEKKVTEKKVTEKKSPEKKVTEKKVTEKKVSKKKVTEKKSPEKKKVTEKKLPEKKKLSEKKISKKVTEKKTNDIILSDNLLPVELPKIEVSEKNIEVPIKKVPKRVTKKNTKIEVSEKNVEVVPVEIPKRVTKKNPKVSHIKENVEVVPVELSEIKPQKKETKKETKITTEAPIVPLEVSVISEKVVPAKKVSKKKTLEKHIEILDPLSHMKLLENFKEQGITVLTPLDEATLSNLLKVANDMYYNGEPLLTDNEFDIIKEYTATKFPKTEVLQEIGAPIQGKNKVELPFEMASMDKIKPDSGALPAWVAKYTGPYVLSCKLDGVSGMYVCDQKGKYSLYTRGNGLVGQDVSHLIKILALPALEKNTAVRGEFILPKSVFAEKYADHFANARNLVSGIINRKSADEKANDLHFVAYEVVQPAMEPSDQMKTMVERGFRVVQHRIVDKLSNEFLSDLLLEWRKEYAYEIDGVIVTNNAIYPRSSGNPDHSFAFKMVISDQVAEAKVVDVLWEASKDGYLKPRVQIEPIQLGGVKIEYATGFNGKFIEDNRIGIGAIIMMVRSGDVIPYIKSITTPAEKAKMPLVPYIWNKTHVDVILENPEENEVVQEKNVTLFFTTLEVDGLAKGNVKKLFRMGHNTVAKIIALSVADLELVEGFQHKTALKLHTSIHDKLQAATLLDIMTASGKLGRGLGKTKLRPILEKYPDILTDATEEKEKLLLSVHGIGKENAREFVSNIPEFLAFLKECGLEGKLKEKKAEAPATVESALTGKKFVMTKVRDKDIINFVTSQGATLEDTMKKDTMVLIVKSKDDVSNKTAYAEKNGIPIMTVEEFKAQFMA